MSARRLESLSVDLQLVSQSYDANIERSRNRTRQFSREARAANDSNAGFSAGVVRLADDFDLFDSSLANSLGRLGAFGAVAGVAIGSLVAAGVATHAVAVNTGAYARELEAQAVAANLSVQAMQEIGYATQAAGVDADKAADIFKDFQDKLGDFRSTGGGSFADFFEQVGVKVGVTADELARLSGPDALIAVQNAMDAANVSADRQVFYLEALAGDAARLSPLLADNGRKFREMVDAYREMDVALTESQIQKFKDYEQDLRDLQVAWDSLSRETVVPFVSLLADGAKFMADIFSTSRTERIGEIKEEISGLESEISDLVENGKKWGGGLTGLWDSLAGNTGTQG